MTTSTIIFGVTTLAVGTIVGFITGYYISKKKEEAKLEFALKQEREKNKKKDEESKESKKEEINEKKESEEDKELAEKASRIISPGPAKIAMPGKPGIDYTAYAKKVEELKYKAESEFPKDSDEDEKGDENADGESLNPDDFMQTYEERVENDNAELTEEFANYKKKHKKRIYILSHGFDDEWPDIHFDEEILYYFTMDDVLCTEDGQFVDETDLVGPDLRKYGWFVKKDMTETTVRNMEYERDYKIKKEFTSYDDFFPSDAAPINEEEDEIE